jgi:hypothetical protein
MIKKLYEDISDLLTYVNIKLYKIRLSDDPIKISQLLNILTLVKVNFTKILNMSIIRRNSLTQNVLEAKIKLFLSNKISKELKYINRIIKDCNKILKNKFLNKNILSNYLNIDIDQLNNKQYIKNKYMTKNEFNNIFKKDIDEFYDNYNDIVENIDDIYENLIPKNKNK